MSRVLNKHDEEYERDFEDDEYDDNDFEDDQLEKIPEVQNEDDAEAEEEINRKINSYRTQLDDKTQRINNLKETIKDATSKLNVDFLTMKDPVQEDEELEDNDNVSGETPFS